MTTLTAGSVRSMDGTEIGLPTPDQVAPVLREFLRGQDEG